MRAILTGVIGALIAWWLMRKWARLVPRGHRGKDAATLLAENRSSIVVANVLFVGILVVGVYLFSSGRVPSSSWPHFAVIAGSAILAGFLAVLLPVIGKGRDRIREAILAFAIAERTPVQVLAVILLIGTLGFVAGVQALSR